MMMMMMGTGTGTKEKRRNGTHDEKRTLSTGGASSLLYSTAAPRHYYITCMSSSSSLSLHLLHKQISEWHAMPLCNFAKKWKNYGTFIITFFPLCSNLTGSGSITITITHS